jgi:N-acyl-phosphatidylethanolamine-hydrolysing phospholipase D
MGPVHMSPDHALHAHRILGARASAGIHYGTFRLADDGRAEAVDRLRALVAQSPMPEDFWILKEGIGRDVFPNEQRHCAQEMMAWLPRRAGDEMR